MWIKIGTYFMNRGQRFIQAAARSTGGAGSWPPPWAWSAAKPPPRGAGGYRLRGEVEDHRLEGFKHFHRPCHRAASEEAHRRQVQVRHLHQNGQELHLLDRDGRATFRSPHGHERRRPEWNYSGSRHIAKSDLRPGDEVFFKEGGSKHITHVGIHSGNGRLVHASSYGGKVVEKEMKRIGGYFGAKRFRSR
jgi:hypothetical protein